tara:strand:+ start:223017 stop:223172 length:156 start_codon:yes stop_codon:yes gene_type:complete
MRKAYLETINDLEIEIRNTGLFQFKKRRRLEKFLENYEKKLEELNEKDLQV